MVKSLFAATITAASVLAGGKDILMVSLADGLTGKPILTVALFWVGVLGGGVGLLIYLIIFIKNRLK